MWRIPFQVSFSGTGAAPVVMAGRSRVEKK
jgi:hypothetical protein